MCRLPARLWLLVAMLALAAAPIQLEAASSDYLPDELLVFVHDPAELGPVAAAFGLDPQPLDQFGSRPIYRLRIRSGAEPQQLAETIAADPRVRMAEPNYTAEAPESRRRTSWAGGDPQGYAEQWAPAVIGLQAAHELTRGAGQTVAVLDTGFELAHPALSGRLRPGYDFVDFDADPSETGERTDAGYGHGTHVAGLVALAAPEATILPIRVLDPSGAGNLWVLAEGLAYAVDPDGNPQTADGASVINLSLGTLRRTALLEQLLAEVTCATGADDDDDDDDEQVWPTLCRGRGALVVAAAGNDGGETPLYPAAEGVAGLLAVAASDRADNLAGFSNRGPWVQLAAPGEAITSSVPGGGYGAWSGTSMATPLTAGTAALLLASDPQLSAAEAADLLVASAIPLCDGSLGRLDAAAALGLPLVTSRCTTGP